MKTYLDSGVLIAACNGDPVDPRTLKALEIIDDPARSFVSSPMLDLELLPIRVAFGRVEELEFMQEYLNATERVASLDAVYCAALAEACVNGAKGADALHVAAAAAAGTEEFVTTEKSTKPIHRSKLIPKITSIRPPPNK